MRVLLIITASFLISACAVTIQDNELRRGSFPLYIQSAFDYLEKDERTDRKELREFLGVDPVRTEWCAAFVNQILALHDIPGSESVSDVPLMARSFLTWGDKIEPDYIQPGDIVVFPRGNQGWQGHVGFYIGSLEKNGVEYYLILGGNQNNEVNMDYFAANRALGIRRNNYILPPRNQLSWYEKMLDILVL
jgi:uncharacterized protein (TIGR02594 family)